MSAAGRVNPTVEGLIAAIRIVNQHHDLGDANYDVRERHGSDGGFTGNSWEHPKVIAYGQAVEQLRRMGALDPLPTDPKEKEREALISVVKAADVTQLSLTTLQDIAALLP